MNKVEKINKTIKEFITEVIEEINKISKRNNKPIKKVNKPTLQVVKNDKLLKGNKAHKQIDIRNKGNI